LYYIVVKLNHKLGGDRMKKIIEKVSYYYIIGIIGLAPLLLLFMYFTYTEKIVAPVLLITLLIAGTTLKIMEE
jgi:hypothetical protein